MIISDPQNHIIGFFLTEWLIEEESFSKSVIRPHLRAVYNALAKLSADADAEGDKEAEEEEEQEEEQKEEAEEEEEQEEEQKEEAEEEEQEEEESDLQWAERELTKTSYQAFSVSESGDVLLISRFEGAEDLFFTGDDARLLLELLKVNAETRVKKLQKLVIG